MSEPKITEPKRKTAILLMAYGSPEEDNDVEPYYTHIRGGRKPNSEELENLRARYKVIGGHSPLNRITQSTAGKLETKLASIERGDEEIKVYAGMKHWHPFISEVFDQITAYGVEDLLSIALAPHYSRMSIGSYQDAVRKANSEHGGKVNLSFVNEWHLNEIFLQEWTRRIEQAYKQKFNNARRANIFFLFSAHSLPENILSWNDPYNSQLLETADRLAEKLGLLRERYGFTFQSAGRTAEPWLGPDILEKLEDLSKNSWREVLVIPIGFVSDHLEILYDIDVESKQKAVELGIHLERTESFNDSQEFINVLASVVRENKGKGKAHNPLL